MFTSFSIMLAIFLIPKLFNPESLEADKMIVCNLGDIFLEDKIIPPKKIEIPPAAQVPVSEKVKQVIFVDPKVVENTRPVENLPPTQEQLNTAVIGTSTIEGKNAGVGDISSTQKAPSSLGTGIVENETVPKKPNEEIIVFASEMPEFPGGHTGLFAYFKSNIRYPAIAREEGIEGTVVLKFTITKNGQITDIKVVKSVAGGCDEEAVRVVKEMPIWKPGKHHGQLVNVSYNLPIKFKLSN
jgi:protein TonB